ncbi:hypothetical protein Tco_1464059, partial [Tanacetum coccineum]
GESDAGLVELSFGCPKLQNLVQGMPRHCRYLLEEDQPNFNQIV